MKRLEIVVDTLHLSRTIDRLRDAGVNGYTVLPNVAGYGDRGNQRADEVSGVCTNAYILLAVPVEQADRIVVAVRSLLQSYGGICLVSDCQWLEH
jgi:nitrogen regulatory protein PII